MTEPTHGAGRSGCRRAALAAPERREDENMQSTSVPFFRPSITSAEIDEVVDTLLSGWLTTGPKTKRFESEFAAAVGARHAIAVNSCTAALHLAVDALGLKQSHAVLVPTMTFAATAEVVRYKGAIPVLVDCDPTTLNMSLEDAESKLDRLRSHALPATVCNTTRTVALTTAGSTLVQGPIISSDGS